MLPLSGALPTWMTHLLRKSINRAFSKSDGLLDALTVGDGMTSAPSPLALGRPVVFETGRSAGKIEEGEPSTAK
jgi:hypothetical protein